jgi:hypothetical protein
VQREEERGVELPGERRALGQARVRVGAAGQLHARLVAQPLRDAQGQIEHHVFFQQPVRSFGAVPRGAAIP